MHKNLVKHSSLKFTPDFPGLSGVTIFARDYGSLGSQGGDRGRSHLPCDKLTDTRLSLYKSDLREKIASCQPHEFLKNRDYPIEPFLVFTEYLMDRPVFGPHPHAGISVMTYMLPDSQDSFINRDSQGDFSIIEPGGLHITQAGSGIQHDEFPKTTGIETHGFQIWINHADKDRLVPPKALHAKAHEIAEMITDDYKVRVVHGSYKDKTSAYKMVTDVTLLHIFLQPNQRIVLDAQEMAFVYVLKGSGETAGVKVSPQNLVNYAATGTVVEIQADTDGCEFMFGTGIPHNEPITYGGPFVMTTPEQMAETKLRYMRGEMGKLERYQTE